MLRRKRKITREFIRTLEGWRHSGFDVFASRRIQPRESPLEKWAALSEKRMDSSAQEATVDRWSEDGKHKKTHLTLQ